MSRSTSDGKLIVRKEKYKEPKPEFSVTETDLPEIKDWKIGKKYTIKLSVEMVSASKGSEYDSFGEEGKEKHRARFKILSASPTEKN